MKKTTQYLVRTALLLAITLLFQSYLISLIGHNPASQFVVGSLVNMGILMTVLLVDFSAGLIVASITPFFSSIGGQLPILVPIVALGNILMVIFFAWIAKKQKIVALIVAAIIKASFLFFAVRLVLRFFTVPEKVQFAFKTLFSFPQLITALIGGTLAIVVAHYVKRALKEE